MFRVLKKIDNYDGDDRLLLFYKLLPIITFGTLIVALIIAGYNIYQDKNLQYNEKTGDMIAEFVLSEKFNKDGDAFLKESGIKNKQAELMLIMNISKKLKQGKINDSFQEIKRIIDNKSYSDITKSYMRLILVSVVLDTDSPSTDQIDFAKNCLSYFTDKNREFFGIAMLLSGLMYKKIGEHKLAGEIVEKILADQNISSNIKENAKIILHD